MTEWERELLGPTEAVIARGVGCKKCLNSGYRGRIGLFEALPDGLQDSGNSSPRAPPPTRYASMLCVWG